MSSAEPGWVEAQMATKEETCSFFLQSPATSYTISHESPCEHVGADSLEMDTKKEKGGQGSAMSKLSLTSHSSPVSAVFPFFSLCSLGLSFEDFVLSPTFCNCAKTFTIVLENQCRWKEGLEKS
jgi:hypothetical protein